MSKLNQNFKVQHSLTLKVDPYHRKGIKDRQTDKRTKRQTDGQTDGRTDRRMSKDTHISAQWQMTSIKYFPSLDAYTL